MSKPKADLPPLTPAQAEADLQVLRIAMDRNRATAAALKDQAGDAIAAATDAGIRAERSAELLDISVASAFAWQSEARKRRAGQ